MMKEFLPFLQTMLGGALTLLGVYIVQGKSGKRERDKHYRETIQQCYEYLLKMESLYLEESVTFYKGVRDGDLKKLRKSEFGFQGSEAFNKATALIELYFPEHEDLIEKLSGAEIEMINFNSDTIDSFSKLCVKTYNKKSDELSENLGEAIFDLKEALAETMRQYTAF